jgi:23S rRNA pseudouridine1911/1915/1917 synthase
VKRNRKKIINTPAPRIIFENKQYFIIDKPAGWVVNDSQTTSHQLTLQSWLKELDYPLNQARQARNGIVHRLDKETSGIIIVAKTLQAFDKLQDKFKNRQVHKKYIALLHGRVEPGEQVIDVPTGRLPWNKKRFGVMPGGKNAFTKLKVKAYYQKDKDIFTLVDFYPKTGRTHQLRVHSKYINHPIVSDTSYAGRKTSRNDLQWCPRTFLHAQSIKFINPVSGKKVEYKTELPKDLKKALDSLTLLYSVKKLA